MKKNSCLCSGCGSVFTSVTGFDGHRYGQHIDRHPDYGRKCRTIFELAGRGWKQGPGGEWRAPVSRAGLNSLRRMRGGKEEQEQYMDLMGRGPCTVDSVLLPSKLNR